MSKISMAITGAVFMLASVLAGIGPASATPDPRCIVPDNGKIAYFTNGCASAFWDGDTPAIPGEPGQQNPNPGDMIIHVQMYERNTGVRPTAWITSKNRTQAISGGANAWVRKQTASQPGQVATSVTNYDILHQTGPLCNHPKQAMVEITQTPTNRTQLAVVVPTNMDGSTLDQQRFWNLWTCSPPHYQ